MSNIENVAAQKFLDEEYPTKGFYYIADTDVHVSLPIAQVETSTCTAGESTGAGDVTMTITSASMANSPLAVVVAVADSDTTTLVTTALKVALAASPQVVAYFTVGGTATTTTLTPIVPIANDSTLALGFVDTDGTGVTFAASANTTAGVMPDSSYTSDSYTVGDYWSKIDCLTDTVFATLSFYTGGDIVGTVTAVTFPSGWTLTGKFKTIDLTSGSVIAYKA